MKFMYKLQLHVQQCVLNRDCVDRSSPTFFPSCIQVRQSQIPKIGDYWFENLSWSPFFRFGLFYLLKFCQKSGKLDILQKYVQNDYQNGPVVYDRTYGQYLRVLVGFCDFHPPPISQKHIPKTLNFGPLRGMLVRY